MTNFEKYKEEILEIVRSDEDIAISEGKPVKCLTISCEDCDFYGDCNHHPQLRIIEWLYKEYVETAELSRFEYEALKHLKAKGYKYLARDADYNMYMYPKMPQKDEGNLDWYADNSTGIRSAGVLNDIFEWVAWSNPEPTSIESVLSNCTIKEEE